MADTPSANGDLVFARPCDMTKARRFGFPDSLDSEAMVFEMFAGYRALKWVFISVAWYESVGRGES